MEDGKIIIPNEFYCPISGELMVDPVVIETGRSFERSSIIAWFELGNNTDPYNKQELTTKLVYPNLNLKEIIDDFRNKYYNKDY